jgi:hypothetical protein
MPQLWINRDQWWWIGGEFPPERLSDPEAIWA